MLHQSASLPKDVRGAFEEVRVISRVRRGLDANVDHRRRAMIDVGVEWLLSGPRQERDRRLVLALLCASIAAACVGAWARVWGGAAAPRALLDSEASPVGSSTSLIDDFFKRLLHR